MGEDTDDESYGDRHDPDSQASATMVSTAVVTASRISQGDDDSARRGDRWDWSQFAKPWSSDDHHNYNSGRGRPPMPFRGNFNKGDPGGSSRSLNDGPGPPPDGSNSGGGGPNSGQMSPPDSFVPPGGISPMTQLAISLPIVVVFIMGFIVFKTWPKSLVWLKHVSRRLGVRRPSDPTVEKAVYFKNTQPSVLYQAQAQLERITVGSANVELSDTVLGRGEYGLVTKGYATGLLGYPPRSLVAVKTLIRPSDPKQRACFLKEIETMMFVGRHLNIVNLLGTVVEGNLMLILEYCANGSLKRFLKKQRSEFFYNHVGPDGLLLPFDEHELQRKQEMLDQRTAAIYGLEVASDDSHRTLSTRDLITISYQIVRGLEYLSSHSVVHRDIAARNVLVTDRTIVKLSDFGMAIQWTSDTSVTEKDFDYPMPIKWMAPESIIRKNFSQKSDVWAFGILLHEVFTLGNDPYPDFTVQGQVMEFIAKITDGFRMPRPAYFPNDLYAKLATKCFAIDPTDRPTFTEIRKTLEDFIPLTRQEEYVEMSQEYEAFNEMFGTMSNNAYVDLNYENINYKKY